MSFDSFKMLIEERQACRSFSDKELDKNDLIEVLKVALRAPSACNSQPWKVYCITDSNVRAEVALALQDGGANAFASSAKAFFVLAEKNAVLKPGIQGKIDNNRFVKYDIGELAAYVTLAAKAKGLDTCVIGWINEEKLKKAVGLAEDEVCNIVIAVGYGNQPLRVKSRKGFEETVKMI